MWCGYVTVLLALQKLKPPLLKERTFKREARAAAPAGLARRCALTQPLTLSGPGPAARAGLEPSAACGPGRGPGGLQRAHGAGMQPASGCCVFFCVPARAAQAATARASGLGPAARWATGRLGSRTAPAAAPPQATSST